MNKTLRLTLILIASPLSVLLVAMVAALLLVDANSYKPELTAAVQKATGRELTVAGELKLSVYPRIGLSIGATELGNAAGFGPEPFATIQAMDVRVNLLPLFYGKVEVGTVVLKGVQLNLAKNEQGVTNWADLEALAAKQQQEQQGPVTPINVEGLAIEDVTVVWDDRQGKQQQQLKLGHLNTGRIQYGKAFPLDLALTVNSSAQQLAAAVALKGELMIDPLAQKYALNGFDLAVEANGKGLPMQPIKAKMKGSLAADLQQQRVDIAALSLQGQGTSPDGKPLGLTLESALSYDLVGSQLDVTALKASANGEFIAGKPMAINLTAPLRFDLAAKQLTVEALNMTAAGNFIEGKPMKAKVSTGLTLDLAAQRLQLSALQLDALGMRLSGEVSGSEIIDRPALSGSLQSNRFDLRQLLTSLGTTLNTADKQALRAVDVSTRFRLESDSIRLDGLKLGLDGSQLSGRLALRQFKQPALEFNLAVDQLNLDRYLPAPSPTPQPAKPVDQNAPLNLPLAMIREQNITGQFKAGSLTVSQVKLAQLDLGVKMQAGVATLRPLRAKLYGGSLDGAMQLDARAKVGRFTLQPQLTGVAINPLLKDLLNNDLIAGKADLKLDVSTAGDSIQALKSSLNGKASFRMLDGAVKGINVAQKAREGMAKLKNQPVSPADSINQTDFAELSGSLELKDGVAHNQDLLAKAPMLRAGGRGWADVGNSKLDYLVSASLVNTLKGQGGKARDELRGLTIPVRIKGPFAEPRIVLDTDELYKANAKAMVDEQTAKLKQKADEELAKQKALAQQQLEQKQQQLEQQAKQKAAEVKQQAEQKAVEARQQAQQKAAEARQQAEQKAEQLRQEMEQKAADKLKGLFGGQ